MHTCSYVDCASPQAHMNVFMCLDPPIIFHMASSQKQFPSSLICIYTLNNWLKGSGQVHSYAHII
jgi:hypothetical protein